MGEALGKYLGGVWGPVGGARGGTGGARGRAGGTRGAKCDVVTSVGYTTLDCMQCVPVLPVLHELTRHDRGDP